MNASGGFTKGGHRDSYDDGYQQRESRGRGYQERDSHRQRDQKRDQRYEAKPIQKFGLKSYMNDDYDERE